MIVSPAAAWPDRSPHNTGRTNMKKIGAGALVASMLLALSAGPAAASDDRDHDRDRPSKVLRFFERGTGNLAFLDFGTPGPSVGDRLTFGNDLFDSRNRIIGRDVAECVIARIDPTESPDRQQIVQCVVTVQLADGQITVQGIGQGTDNFFAVTGGTGAYRNARGEARARDIVPLVEAEITIWLFK
jgi:hypothetical protein